METSPESLNTGVEKPMEEDSSVQETKEQRLTVTEDNNLKTVPDEGNVDRGRSDVVIDLSCTDANEKKLNTETNQESLNKEQTNTDSSTSCLNTSKEENNSSQFVDDDYSDNREELNDDLETPEPSLDDEGLDVPEKEFSKSESPDTSISSPDNSQEKTKDTDSDELLTDDLCLSNSSLEDEVTCKTCRVDIPMIPKTVVEDAMKRLEENKKAEKKKKNVNRQPFEMQNTVEPIDADVDRIIRKSLRLRGEEDQYDPSLSRLPVPSTSSDSQSTSGLNTKKPKLKLNGRNKKRKAQKFKIMVKIDLISQMPPDCQLLFRGYQSRANFPENYTIPQRPLVKIQSGVQGEGEAGPILQEPYLNMPELADDQPSTSGQHLDVQPSSSGDTLDNNNDGCYCHLCNSPPKKKHKTDVQSSSSGNTVNNNDVDSIDVQSSSGVSTDTLDNNNSDPPPPPNKHGKDKFGNERKGFRRGGDETDSTDSDD